MYIVQTVIIHHVYKRAIVIEDMEQLISLKIIVTCALNAYPVQIHPGQTHPGLTP